MDRNQLGRLVLCFSPLIAATAYPGLGAYVGFVIAGLIVALNAQARASVFKMLDRGWARTAALGVAGGIGLAIIARILPELLRASFGWEIDMGPFAAVEGNLNVYLVSLLVGIVVGGILEELTFRGLVIGWGTKLLGERAQVWLALLAAAVFGLSHFYQGIAGMITTGVLGALLGLLYIYANRSLLVVIIAHSVINIIMLTIVYMGWF